MQRCRIFHRLRSKYLPQRAVSILIILSLIFQILVFVPNTIQTSKAWWNVNWQYYKVCYIDDNGYSGYYQMRLNVSYSSGGDVSCEGHCQADFDDIRFVDIDNSTVLPYWKETYVDSQYAIFWVNVSADAIGDGKILMYYGNSEAADASDGDETFLFFDDFDTLDTNIWEEYDPDNAGSISAENGNLHIHIADSGGHTVGAITKNTVASADGTLLVGKVKGEKLTNNYNYPWLLGAPVNDNYNFYNWYRESDKYRYADKVAGSTVQHTYSTESYPSLEWRIIYIKLLQESRKGGAFTDYYDGTRVGSEAEDTRTGTTNDYKIRFMARSFDAGMDSYCDWVFVAKYSSSPPSWSGFGSEQSSGWANNPPTITNPYPANESVNVPLQPTLSATINDTDGNSTNVWLWTSEDGGETWTLRNSTTFPDGNGTITYDYIEANQGGTTYYWKVSANDSHANTTKIYHFTTKYEYTEQSPQPQAWWDGVYENYTEVGRWAWINISKQWDDPDGPGAGQTENYKPFMTDRDPYTHYRTVSFDISESNPLYVWMDFHNSTNVSFMRFYYYDENGLQYCPAFYRIYADGNLIYTGNETASVNGQWVVIDFPDQTNIHNLTWKIVATRGSIDSGNPTKVSISYIEVFSNDTPLVIEQKDIPYFEEIPRWWNGLQWALSWRVDDVTSSSDIPTSWLNTMPLTICWMSSFSNLQDVWEEYVNTYHAEIASHYGQAGASTGSWDYSTAYDKASYGRDQIEAYCDKVSLWSDKVITYGVPYSRYNGHYAKAFYDAGYRAMGYGAAGITDKYPQHTHIQTWVWNVRDPQNMSAYNVIIPHYETDFIFHRTRGAKPNEWDDTKYVQARENGSWILTINHPGESPQSAFYSFIENEVNGWHCTIGEVASYTWYRLFTNVTLNETASNSTCKVFDINIHKDDDRIWEVPVTFKFNISGTPINNSTINQYVKVKWRNNGTVYKDTWENIGGFFAGSGQHTNQTMREGFRIEGNYLYLSFKPGNASAQKSIYLFIKSPPTLTNPSATPSSGVADYTVFYFNITYSDPDGDPPTEIKVNISKTGWYLNATMTYVSGDNETGALYSYSTTLSAGTYDYFFYASDGTDSVVNDPTDQVSVEAQSYSFTVSTADPSGQENFTASATMGAEWNVDASYQTSSIPAIQITNTGNVPIDISISLTSAPIGNVHIKYNTSPTPPSFTQNPYYCDKELTTTPVTVFTIGVGETGDIWLWADFENKTNPGSYTTELYISSTFGG